LNTDSARIRRKVAREAATLLYFGLEKEYKQAKLKATEILGSHVLPTNLEVALELDSVAEENEGPSRNQRLIRMRMEALKTMVILKAYRPVLIGSVWRGTVRRGSDIDLSVYHDNPEEIVDLLKASNVKIVREMQTNVNKHGRNLFSFHIYVEAETGDRMEIVVRASEEAEERRRCETFGDYIKGLRIQELEKILEQNPAKRFIPTRTSPDAHRKT